MDRYEENLEEYALGLVNELPYTFRYIFYERQLDEEADIYIWLYCRLVIEMERRRAITPEPSQAAYEKILAEQKRTAKRVNMTREQFWEERFMLKIAPVFKKRSKEFMAANYLYVFDENMDIEYELKKIFGNPQ